MNGVIIGRFMPPHNGHLYLIDFARHMVDRLYILVCTLSHEPIPGEMRYQWVSELAPTCRTIHITEEIPEARRGAEGATAIWARTVEQAVPEQITHVFASEEYGWDLAEHLQAQFVPVDQSRSNIPVSATAVRRDPYGTWKYIPPPVRPYFVRHVAVVGDPGLTETLANDLETVVVHSYRTYIEQQWNAADSPTRQIPGEIVRPGIEATAKALARHANRILLYDIADPHDLSEIGAVDAVVAGESVAEVCAALVPERPIFDTSTVTSVKIVETLLR